MSLIARGVCVYVCVCVCVYARMCVHVCVRVRAHTPAEDKWQPNTGQTQKVGVVGSTCLPVLTDMRAYL